MTDTPMTSELEINQAYLQLAFQRLDILLRREIQRWQLAGQRQDDEFRGLYVSDHEAVELLERPFGFGWGNLVDLPDEIARFYDETLRRVNEELARIAKFAKETDALVRLLYLQEAFSLTQIELDTLMICLAPSLDSRYEKLYGYLQDDVTRKRPSIQLVLTLLSEPGYGRVETLAYLTRIESPLYRFHLLKRSDSSRQDTSSILTSSLELDETIVHWLLGSQRVHPLLDNYATLQNLSGDDADQLPLTQESKTKLEVFLPPRRPREGSEDILLFYGSDLLAQETAAKWFAIHDVKTINNEDASAKILILDFSLTNSQQTEITELMHLAIRDARLHDALLFIKGWDTTLNDGFVREEVFSSFCYHAGRVILSSKAAWLPTDNDLGRRFHAFYYPIPGYVHRMYLWEYYLNLFSQSELILKDVISSDTLHLLAGQFALNTGQIRDAAAAAISKFDDKIPNPQISADILLASARTYSNPKLSSLAQKITPKYSWEDIILPADQRQILQEVISTVRERPRVLDEWGVGLKLASSRGITVLFAGPPGTGKTMAAEIIARFLGLDLFKIDLSGIVSKYIGETEKNLERIFNEAASSNAILFFDEADALFGKRSEVRDSHDRYANIEVSYLLQRMEAYDGVTILATNLRANLDEAFTRRLHFAVDFPFPEAPDRLRIWKALFPPTVPHSDDLDFELLAKKFKLAGGNIRNIIVNAAYLAASNGGEVKMEHLLHGTRRELQKMGRLVSDNDIFWGGK